MTKRSKWRATVKDWLIDHLVHSRTLLRAFGRGEPDTGTVTLDRGKVFILPTAHGLAFGFILLVMLIGSVNYNNNLGLIFTFLVGGALLISILHSYRNLAGLGFRAGRVEPVFAGQRAGFALCIVNPEDRPRYSLQLSLDLNGEQGGKVLLDVPASTSVAPLLEKPAPKRGLLPFGRVAVETRYPLGMFRAWSYLEPVATCAVYPQPGPRRPLPAAAGGEGDGSLQQGSGSDDFAGLRAYRPGDSPRRIYWKSVAAGMEPQTKLFSGASGAELWLDWQDLSAAGTEARLSQMCRWVLDAELSGCRYGLRIPGSKLPQGRGLHHQARCLEALAMYTDAGLDASLDAGLGLGAGADAAADKS